MSMSPDPTKKAILRRLTQLAKNDAGSMTINAIVMFVLLTGVGGLAVDLGRYYGVHGQMQAFVDDVALSAAAELDNYNTAPCRAVIAATGVAPPTSVLTPCGGLGNDPNGALVVGLQNFANGATNLDIQQITFLDALGP